MIVTVRQFGPAEYLRYHGYSFGPPVVFHYQSPRRYMVREIQEIVARHFRLDVADMKSARRSRDVARPRQIAMYLAKEFTPQSLPQIGRMFGDRDHTTVIHALRQIEKLRQSDPEVAVSVRVLEQVLAG